MRSTNKSGPLSQNLPKRSFFDRNLVALVTIPAIIAIHLGWGLLQNNRKLVSEEEQKEQPIVAIGKRVWARFTDKTPAAEVPTVAATK